MTTTRAMTNDDDESDEATTTRISMKMATTRAMTATSTMTVNDADGRDHDNVDAGDDLNMDRTRGSDRH